MYFLPMIGLLTGFVVYREDPAIILDVHGVGYKVLVPLSVLNNLPTPSESLTLFIHTHVREDVLELYGFTQPQDLKLFELLISVSGIGCKTAQLVFSVGSRGDIINAIATNDVSFFTNVPRLGKKNAQKIIIELKNKIGGEDIDLAGENDNQDVIAALKTFGYSGNEVQRALRALPSTDVTLEEKVRLALKQLGK